MFLLAAAHPAHAQYGGGPGGPGGSGGSWGDPTTTYSGSFDYNYVYYGTTYTGPDSWAAHYSQFLWVNSDPGVPSNVTSQGTYTVKRTWSGSTPPPTKPVYILETSRAVGSGGIYGTTPGSGTAQDAFSDPPVPVSGGAVSSGKKLIQVDGSSGVISLSGTVSASGNTPANDYSSVQGNNAVYSGVDSSFSWDFDSRALFLSGPDTSEKVPSLDASGNQTSDNNGDPNFTSAPNIADADGTMHGDTIYSYHNYVSQSPGDGYGAVNPPPPVDEGTINWIEFTPVYAGNWHYKSGTDHNGKEVVVPNVVDPDTWKWSPNESEDTWDYGKCSMPWAPKFTENNSSPTGQDSPKTYPVSYSAIDNTDQAKATANYVMMVHDPYEKNYTDHTQDMTDDANERKLGDYGTQAQFDGSTISATVTTGNPWTVTVKGSGEIPLPWIGGAIGVDVEKTVTDDAKIGVSCSDNHTKAGDYSYPEAVDHYIRHYGKVDTWSTGGYTGTQVYQIWDIGQPAYFLRLHYPYGNATKGPPPPSGT